MPTPFEYHFVMCPTDDGKPVWVPAEPGVAGNEITIMPAVPCGCRALIEGPLWPDRREALLDLLTAQRSGMLR